MVNKKSDYIMKMAMVVTSLAVLSGCAGPGNVLPPQTQVLPASGYVGGNFTLLKNTHASAFLLTHQITGEIVSLRFTSKPDYADGHNETILVSVPPGMYRVTHWMLYNSFTGPNSGGKEMEAKVDSGPLAERFVVRPGEVVFLGKFEGRGSWTPGIVRNVTTGGWAALKTTEQEARNHIRTTYPGFASAPMICLSCTWQWPQ